MHFAGITDGIENTNYFVTTSEGQYVLTLFEIVGTKELPYFLDAAKREGLTIIWIYLSSCLYQHSQIKK